MTFSSPRNRSGVSQTEKILPNPSAMGVDGGHGPKTTN